MIQNILPSPRGQKRLPIVLVIVIVVRGGCQASPPRRLGRDVDEREDVPLEWLFDAQWS
jgi:hypothetical protein